MLGRWAAWLASVALTVVVATATKVGPTLVDFGGSHGIHVGDLLTLTVGVACAAHVSGPVVRRAPA